VSHRKCGGACGCKLLFHFAVNSVITRHLNSGELIKNMGIVKSHFWIGQFESEELYNEFIREDYSLCDSEDYDDTPISKFAESQGETWIDHDFLESGFEPHQVNIKEQFGGYSYAEEWGAELEKNLGI